jgi:hypothetical protein
MHLEKGGLRDGPRQGHKARLEVGFADAYPALIKPFRRL